MTIGPQRAGSVPRPPLLHDLRTRTLYELADAGPRRDTARNISASSRRRTTVEFSRDRKTIIAEARAFNHRGRGGKGRAAFYAYTYIYTNYIRVISSRRTRGNDRRPAARAFNQRSRLRNSDAAGSCRVLLRTACACVNIACCDVYLPACVHE